MTRLYTFMVKKLAVISIIIGVAILPLLVANQYQLRLVIVGGIYMLLVLGLNFMLGYTGLLSFAQVGFFAIGAYATGILTVDYNWPFSLTLIGGLGIAGGMAWVLGWPVLKLKSHYFMFATFVIAELCREIATNWDAVTHGATGILAIPRPRIEGIGSLDNTKFYYLVLVAIVAGIYISWRIERSNIGRALMAIRESEIAAQTMGINTAKIKRWAFVFSAIYASVAGSLYASFTTVISPDVFAFDITIVTLVSLLLGGVGSILGALLGTAIVYSMPEILRGVGEYYMIIYGCGIVLLMTFLPKGIVGTVGEYRIRIAKRKMESEG